MNIPLLSRHIRAVLEQSPDALSLPDLLARVDDFVATFSASSDNGDQLHELEEGLQAIYDDLVDHSAIPLLSSFLAVLHRLQPLLSSNAIISTWFDLVLRPSLREPRLHQPSVEHAKELVLSAFCMKDNQTEKVADFRRRLFDLYLLDAFNEGSGKDVLEWAELDDEQRTKRQRWKANLEDILISLGKERPQDLMTEAYDHFMTPSSRLQLLILLDTFVSDPSFPAVVPILAQHPLLLSLLSSLLIDGSSTTCTVGLTLLIKLLPLLAIHACEELKRRLPEILAILQRILCWKERLPYTAEENPTDTVLEEELEAEMNPALQLRPEFGWNRLEAAFLVSSSSVPIVRPLFTLLYYLFPCNLLHFLRSPIVYLQDSGLECPYVMGWQNAIDEPEIRSKSERLVRGHVCHISILWSSTEAELAEPMFWQQYDIARIATESRMLDIRNTIIGLRARRMDLVTQEKDPAAQSRESDLDMDRVDEIDPAIPTIDPTILEPGRVRISLEKMISVSIALKSNLDVDVMEPSGEWTKILFPSAGFSPRKAQTALPLVEEVASGFHNDDPPLYITQALSTLMREVLLLRNELNFELWLSRENIKHVGRLFQDRLLSKNAESERQGLYNKLRRYRAQVTTLERELEEYKSQAATTKSKYEDWNSELQSKLRAFRKDKDEMLKECSSLRIAANRAESMFNAQKTFLADATNEVFELKTRQKEVQHKIDRLHDYEKQIEQHVKIQSLWDADFEKFNRRASQIDQMQARLEQLQQEIQSYVQTTQSLEELGRSYRRQIQTLEARLALQNSTKVAASSDHEADIAMLVREKSELTTSVEKLRDENAELIEELEELRVMVEVLKGQISSRGVMSPQSKALLI